MSISLVDGMLGDSSDNVAQVGLGINAIWFCDVDYIVDCTATSAVVLEAKCRKFFLPRPMAREAHSAALFCYRFSMALSSMDCLNAAH